MYLVKWRGIRVALYEVFWLKTVFALGKGMLFRLIDGWAR